MEWAQNMVEWNECHIKLDATIRDAGNVFRESDLEEIMIVNTFMQPWALMTRQDYIKFSLQENLERPVGDCSFDNSWAIVNRGQTLPQLLLVKADYLVRVDDQGRFQDLIPKWKIVDEYIEELNTPFIIAGNVSMVGVVDAAGEKVYLNMDRVHVSWMDDTMKRDFCRSPLWEELVNSSSVTGIQGEEMEWNGITWLVYALPVCDNDELLGAIGIFYYSAAVQTLNREMRHLEEMYKGVNSIIETSYDGFTITNGDGLVLRVNPSHGRITGIRREDMVGKYISDCVKEGLFSNPVTMKVLNEKRTITVQQRMKNGKLIVVTGSPVLDANGNIIMVVCNLRDITELSALQEKLAETEQSSKRYLLELEHLRKQQLQNDKIVAVSEAMQNIQEQVKQVGDKDVTVMLLGETGVGKGVIAKEIHKTSNRRNQPFIDINCGAIPENLLESELFGYETGAFTGARKGGKPGIFEMAQHGTLFLDEIGELPLALQVKLLKALQDKRIMRVGGTVHIPVDVRIVCATNRNLREMMANGTFRADLYYRLVVLPIYIPALRERKDDIMPLVYYYLDKFNQKYSCEKNIEPGMERRLLEYAWPGNVRELENMIERYVVTQSSIMTNAQQSPDLYNGDYPCSILAGDSNEEIEIIPLRKAVEETEKHLIVQALRQYGSMGKAAKCLGLDRTTVLRKISKYHIPYSYSKD